jgi:uncharacterized protein (DUF1330 family)
MAAKGYWIAQVDVTNPEAYKAYQAANAVPLRLYGARFLVRGGQAETVEGKSRARVVVLEFKDLATAQACYHSPEYAAARALRQDHSTGDVIIVEGYEGAQPGA